MKTKIILLLALALIGLQVSGQNSNTNISGFNFRFLDEGTGYAVIPESVEIKDREGKHTYIISKNQISRNGTASIKVDNGTYDINVKAQEYELMTTFFQMANQILNVNINLVPIRPLKVLSSSYIQSLHRTDAMVIVGFVVDDITGKPLGNVSVFTSDKIIKTFSNDNGFFQLIIPLSANEQGVEKRGTIYFKKNNYTTEVRHNFDMWANGDVIFQIRMKKGTGLNSIKVLENREANRMTLDNIILPDKKQ